MVVSRRGPRFGPPRRRYALITVLALTAILLAPRAFAQRVRPLDPLTPRETQLAQRLARADARVRDLIGNRRSVTGSVDFVALKPEPPDSFPVRSAVVEFYVYDGDYGVRALVDFRRQAVTEVDRIDREPIPFATEEIVTAKRLAMQDTSVRQKLGAEAERFRVDWLGVTARDEHDPCFKHRCLQLLFSRRVRGRDLYLTRPAVVVDLTTQTVRMEEP